jgi:hypothetical protein
MANKPRLIQIPNVPRIHLKHPDPVVHGALTLLAEHIDKNFQLIAKYLNRNVKPIQGNRQ